MARPGIKERQERAAKFAALAAVISRTTSPDAQSLARSYGLKIDEVEHVIKSARA